MTPTTPDRQARIRARAHAIWEGEGRPEGRHDDHWHQAAREHDEEQRPRGEEALGAELSPDRHVAAAAALLGRT